MNPKVSAARSSLTLALLVTLVALIPLAHASPPDPTWVSGFFDDDDNDNGVFLITSSQAALDPFPLCSWAPCPVPGVALMLEGQSPAPSPDVASTDARAPPVS